MALKYAILGLLSWRAFSGYEMKKVLSDSTALYWSGNSNQVYPTLVQLHKDGLVTSEVRQQGNYPPGKVYSLTSNGRDELRKWVMAEPALPQIRNPFLTQLAWADQLDEADLTALLDRYEHELQMKLLMQRELERREPEGPHRTPRETLLWKFITGHDACIYECELQWVARLRTALRVGPYERRRLLAIEADMSRSGLPNTRE